MKKFKHWLINKFLPAWAKETLLEENKKLEAENKRLRQEKAELNAYINGLESGIRVLRRITINTGEVRK